LAHSSTFAVSRDALVAAPKRPRRTRAEPVEVRRGDALAMAFASCLAPCACHLKVASDGASILLLNGPVGGSHRGGRPS
jgi:hypothetical protein